MNDWKIGPKFLSGVDEGWICSSCFHLSLAGNTLAKFKG